MQRLARQPRIRLTGMNHLLALTSSLSGADGVSTRLVEYFLRRWHERATEDRITRRDLAAEPLPHLDRDTFAAFSTAPEKRSASQRKLAERSDMLIDEFLDANVVVLGAPMYNFSVPSTLKAYIDHLARAGRTFRYTKSGAIGLAGDTRMVVLSARGSIYKGSSRDLQTPYLKQIFALMGVRDIRFIAAEGLNVSDKRRERAIAGAQAEIDELIDSSFS